MYDYDPLNTLEYLEYVDQGFFGQGYFNALPWFDELED